MKNIYFVGAPTLSKGIEDYQEIAAIYKKAKFNWFCYLISDGQKEKYPDIHFISGLNDKQLKEIISEKMDLFVSCSYYEGFCLPIAEAVLAGKPVVSYRLEEIVAEFENYVDYVSAGNKRKMLEEIQKKLRISTSQKRILEAKKHVERNYSPQNVMNKFFSIVNEAADMRE